MIQNFLDGKKKYSAFIITILATLIPLFVTEPEAQKTILDIVPSLAAVLAGIIYIVTQAKVDQTKEAAKVEIARANGNGAAPESAYAGGAAAAPSNGTLAAAAEAMKQIDLSTFDVKVYHQAVLDTVEASYKETNPATIFYKARDTGAVTRCTSDADLLQYWDYLQSLAVDARDWLRAETDKKKGACGRSPEFYVLNRDVTNTVTQYNEVYDLIVNKTDWRNRLLPFQQNLYTIGVLAYMLAG